MRKFLAVILTVLTLVSVVLPTFAAEEVVAMGTTADDAKNLSLIVTEYISDSKSPDVGPFVGSDGKTVASTTYNAFQYIEIYNSGEEDIDLSKVSIAAVSNSGADATGKKYWADYHQFSKKMNFETGSIFKNIKFKDDQNLKDKEAVNPSASDMVLKVGQTAVIWFWNDATHAIASKMTTSPGATVGGVYHKGFKEFYGMDDNALVIAVYAGSDVAGKGLGNPNHPDAGNRFSLNTTDGWCYYGLIDERGMGATGWSVNTPVWDAENGFNEKVLAIFGWGTSTHHSIQPSEGKSTVYVPANTTPDLYNENIKATLADEGDEFTPAADYVANKYVESYKELAVLDFDQAPTPGAIPAWQQAYIDASKGAALDTAVVNAFVNATKKVPENVTQGAEEKIEVNFKDRSELGNKGQGKKQDDGKGNGLALWLLIVIIVGGVLVLGGVAAVIVFVVILPKKKKAAAAIEATAEVTAEAEAAPAEEKVEE